jgi:rod shape determining protein RodA
MKPLYIFSIIAAGISTAPFILKPYQKDRLLVFLKPDSDPQGIGWNLLQSKIAIGSGKLFGKGLFSGTQSQLSFVPENSTDFIFTIAGEELGFIGCIIIVLLYLLLIKRSISISREAPGEYGKYVALGIAVIFFFHICVNIGMTIGIMPVTGIPLFFLSYGGSSLLTAFICVGILINISIRRVKIF